MIIITGITGGIGNYLFQAFRERNEDVIGTYHLNKPEGGAYSDCVQLDITDNAQVEAFVRTHAAGLKNITLINCAGVSYNAFAHKSDVQEWAQVINVNLNGTFYLVRAILPLMREQQFGRIINLSSVVAQSGVIGTSAYAASKAGLNGMIKSIALENAQKNITINNINLGYFNVGMINTVPPDMQNEIRSKIPSHAFGDPSEIFKTIAYMRESNYLNGACVDLNGGLL